MCGMKRKIYAKLLEWKRESADKYALLIEGARRVGKSYVAEEFARREYESHLILDFAKVKKSIKDLFEDKLDDLDDFFLQLGARTGVRLVPGKTLIVFDEVQRFPRAREAVKYLVADGRYHYLETGSLISLRKNVEDIVIPSEEMKIQMYPMDFEEFLMAIGKEGQNARLAAKLTGWKIDIKSESQFRQILAEAQNAENDENEDIEETSDNKKE